MILQKGRRKNAARDAAIILSLVIISTL